MGMVWDNTPGKNPGEEKQEGSHMLALVSSCGSPAGCLFISCRARTKIKASASSYVATVPLWSYLKWITAKYVRGGCCSLTDTGGMCPHAIRWDRSSKPETNLPLQSVCVVLKFLCVGTFFFLLVVFNKKQSFMNQTKPHYPTTMLSCQVPIWTFTENSTLQAECITFSPTVLNPRGVPVISFIQIF